MNETADKTTISGLDAAGRSVARLDLVHGRFALTGIFRDEYPTAEVIGRKLDIDVLGNKFVWETAGFTPTLRMPAHPAKQWQIAAFVEDPHVKPVLARWQIGFKSPAATTREEASYYDYQTLAGTNGGDCESSTNCGQVQSKNINMCNGGTANSGVKISVDNPATPGYEQIYVAQCCPTGTGNQTNPWLGYKTCPTSGSTSDCGTGAGACKGCGIYDASALCSLGSSSTLISAEWSDWSAWGQCGELFSCMDESDCDAPQGWTASCSSNMCFCMEPLFP